MKKLILFSIMSFWLTSLYGAYKGPVIDAHVHVSDPDGNTFQKDMKEANVTKAISMSFPGKEDMLSGRYDNIVELCEADFVRYSNLSTKHKDKKCPGYGEVGLRHYNKTKKRRKGKPQPTLVVSFDEKSVTNYLDIANESLSPVVLHIEPFYDIDGIDNLQEVKNFYTSICRDYPKLPLIASHTGMMSAGDLNDLLTECDNLYADFKIMPGRNGQAGFRDLFIIHTKDTRFLHSDWKALFEKYPDRFLFGSDWKTYRMGRRHGGRLDYSDGIEITRKLLSTLPDDVQEKILYKNAKRIFQIND